MHSGSLSCGRPAVGDSNNSHSRPVNAVSHRGVVIQCPRLSIGWSCIVQSPGSSHRSEGGDWLLRARLERVAKGFSRFRWSHSSNVAGQQLLRCLEADEIVRRAYISSTARIHGSLKAKSPRVDLPLLRCNPSPVARV
jgi:hypothetical protein